jgi:lysyl-tRNA synthetase class 2
MTENWQPGADPKTLRQRARILQDIRVFFSRRKIIEVQVPLITSSSVTEVHIDSIPVQLQTENAFLHTSPEYPMKRLLAAGMDDCYFLGPVFRQGERGTLHNPEFTMLEWYRLNFSLEQLITEALDLIKSVLQSDVVEKRYAYAEALELFTGLDIYNISIDKIKNVLIDSAIDIPEDMHNELDSYLDLLMSTLVFPKLVDVSSKLKQITVIRDYPESQAALAQIHTNKDGQQIAARFEVFVDGLEIANGYQEIQDAELLELRFVNDNKKRKILGKGQMPIDTYLLDAMRAGLPDCSGVALGVDRLVMLALDKSAISEVIAFTQERC